MKIFLMQNIRNRLRRRGEKLKSILKDLYEMRINSSLEKRVMMDELYQKNSAEILHHLQSMENVGLNKKQKDVVDEYVALHNKSNYEYARIAYSVGFEDAMHLALELYKDNKDG